MSTTYIKRQSTIFIFLLVSAFLGCLSLVCGFQNQKKVTLRYQEENSIDYKVYLKENDYFDEKYIEKGKTYITSLIDHIHVDYQYNINFNEPVDAVYTYKVVAKIEANKSDNENNNYWTKEYNITKEKKETSTSKQNYVVNQSVDIDYNYFNEILNGFKTSLGLSNSAGILKVYLIINSKVQGEYIEKEISNDLILKLPLSQMAIEASIESDENNNMNEISTVIRDYSPIYFGLVLLGILLIVISILSLWLIIRNKRVYSRNHRYELELKHILTTYDSIIVNVKEKPNIEDYNVIKVENFNELIDAHSEVRMPINFYQTDKTSVFLLFNENSVWRYILRKDNKKGVPRDEK